MGPQGRPEARGSTCQKARQASKTTEPSAALLRANAEPDCATELPGDAVTTDETGDGPAELLLDDRTPGEEGELPRIFDEGILAACRELRE